MIESETSVESFLCNLLIESLEIDEKLDLALSPDSYGLDSLSAIKITEKLSKFIDFELEPSVLYEYDSIKDLSKYLTGIHSKKSLNKTNEIKKQTVNLTIAASFTAEPVEESLTFCLEELNLQPEISFSSYNQIIQELVNPVGSLISTKGIKVILLRVEDWFRYENNKVSIADVQEMVKSFISYLANAASKNNSEFILFLAPHLENDLIRLGLENEISSIDQFINSELKAINNLYIINENIEEEYNIKKTFDKDRDKIGHIPFTQEYFTALGVLLARKIFKLKQTPAKVILLDCDNTLWKGVCGEEGYKVLPNAGFQKFILQQKDEGKLLCLCSKNIESDVFEVFEKNTQMILKKDDFVTHRINWESKSQNIISIAKELNLGLDSFIFIDDNELECAEVKSVIKNINVINYPLEFDEAGILDYFNHNWLFDSLKVTKEDLKKTEMYQQNKLRDELQTESGGFEEFLEKLNIQIEINELNQENITRAAQLTQKTNQFNATTIRLSENELRELVENKGYKAYTVNVSDRFGDYGIVGFMLTNKNGNVLNLHSFLLSCRVLGKRVEHNMINYLVTTYFDDSVDTLKLNFIPTERNKPLANFYNIFGDFNENSSGWGLELLLPFAEIKNVLENGKSIIEQHSDNSKENNTESVLKVHINSELVDKLDLIAKFSSNIPELLNKIRTKKIIRPSLPVPFITPRTSMQKSLCHIFSDILGVDRIGIYDSFYDLGGDSLKLAELSIKLWEIGLPEDVPLCIIEKPTVDLFSKIIEHPDNFGDYIANNELYSLEDDSKLSFDFDFTNQNIVIEKNPKHILLTGVTGYVGAYLLYELLTNTESHIYCHVRAKNSDEGFERIKKNLRTYDLWDKSFEERISIAIGDLTKPNLGLTGESYQSLVDKIDTIYHNGAWVNFIFPYSMLKPANVTGTENIIRFATDKKIKVLHFISTLGVLMSGKRRDSTIFEDEELMDSEDLPNGYEQTKWVADKMVWRAMKKGLPVNIYRLGMLSGLAESGIYHKLNEFLPSFLKGCIQIESFPDISTKIEMVPVDFVVKSLVNISKENQVLGKTYQMNHPDAMIASGFANWINDYGYPLRLLPWDIWKNQLLKSGDRLRENALYPYIDFIKALQEHQTFMPEMDMSNFLDSIKDTELNCYEQDQLLEKYFNYFIEQEYLPNPN